jgi:hypothetical protein
MSKISNMPERPLYLHEVRLINEENKEVQSSEALFYKNNNLNAVICLFVNISGTGYILGYNKEDGEWIELTSMDEKEGSIEEYNESSDNIVSWISDQYGEDSFGIYQMFGS